MDTWIPGQPVFTGGDGPSVAKTREIDVFCCTRLLVSVKYRAATFGNVPKAEPLASFLMEENTWCRRTATWTVLVAFGGVSSGLIVSRCFELSVVLVNNDYSVESNELANCRKHCMTVAVFRACAGSMPGY